MKLNVKKITFNQLEENTYIVYNEAGDCAIIDPGCSKDEEKMILENFIIENKLKPILLLNTHCHFDHVFGNGFVFKKWNLPLHIHREEKYFLDSSSDFAMLWGFECDSFNGKIIFIDEKTSLKIGNDEIKIFHTPGHSPGSISFYSAENKFVISGDVLFNSSIGRTDLPNGDLDTLIHSIKTKLYTLPDDTTVYCGHGDETTIEFEKTSNPFVK